MTREPTVEDFERNEEKYIEDQAKIFKEYVENNEPFCSLRERILNMKTSDFSYNGFASIPIPYSEVVSEESVMLFNNIGNLNIKELTNTIDLIGEIHLVSYQNVRLALKYHHPDMDQSKIAITQNGPVKAPKLTRGEKVTQWFKNLCMRKD